MKQTFSTHWISSTQPRKQRKYRHNAPLHVRGHFLHVHLSPELRTKHSTRAIRVRVGDEVKVLRGQFAGKTGKVERIDVTYTRVFVAGVENTKRDGGKKSYPMQPSKLMLTKLAEDKRRFPVAQKTRTPKAPNTPKPAAKAPAKQATPKTTDTKQAKPKTAKK